MKDKPFNRTLLFFYALASLAVALWCLGYAIFDPVIVGPLLYVALALTCCFLAFSSHYFHRWFTLTHRRRGKRTGQ